jgi:dihydroorotase
MNILIKKATILHQSSEFHLSVKDILISDGIISQIQDEISHENAKIISGNKLYCFIGLCDIGTHTGEPGYEHRETIDSLTRSALAGGYTALVVFPNNKPVIQSKADISYLVNHRDRNGVSIYPIGALSKDIKGADIAEYMDMKSGGAIAFSDGLKSVQDTGLLGRALQYASATDVAIINHPNDDYLSAGGEMHEGEMSTSLGMRGIPDIAELHMIQRDILLNAYHNSQIIEHAISSARSVEAIRQAKNEQNNIHATVAYMNLLFTDSDLYDFESNLKVSPVLRSETDKQHLIEGINDDTVSAIVSNHTPLDEEAKNLEFPYATPGATGLETCLSACVTYLSQWIALPTLVHKLTMAPRKLLKIEVPQIAVGVKADLCVFDVERSWIYSKETMCSKSANNTFVGKELKGKVIATIIG